GDVDAIEQGVNRVERIDRRTGFAKLDVVAGISRDRDGSVERRGVIGEVLKNAELRRAVSNEELHAALEDAGVVELDAGMTEVFVVNELVMVIARRWDIGGAFDGEPGFIGQELCDDGIRRAHAEAEA